MDNYGLNSFYVQLYLLLFIIYLYKNILIENNEDNKIYFFLCSIMFIISAFRGEYVGGDLDNYLLHFKEVSKNFSQDLYTSNFEVGYTTIVKIISLFSSSNRFYLICTSFISLIGPFCFIRKYSLIPCISLFIYMLLGFYTNTFNNVRQSMAISIYLLSIPYLLNDNYKRFVILVLLAASIHLSAIVCLLCLLIKKIEPTIKNYIKILIFSLLFFYFIGETLFSNVIIMIDKYSDYDGGLGEGYGMLMFYIILSIISFVTYKKFSLEMDEYYRMYLGIFTMFMTLVVSIQMYAPLYSSMLRLTFYFYLPIIVIIPSLIYYIRYSYLRKISISVVLLLLLFYSSNFVYAYNSNTGSNSQAVIPYEFSFE